MTANELADKLQELDSKLHLIELFEAATMLRQQQDEIERLIMLCDCMTTESNRKGNEIEELKDFAIWMTGCGYDFRQHIYYNECFDKLLMKEKEHE